jgi:TPR repeat protein
MSVSYCNAECQRTHWPKHKKLCKQRSAELYDEALFKDPPPKEDCPICFLPMPNQLIACISLPLATLSSVPVHDFAIANKELANKATEEYYQCCGKSICRGCIYSFCESGNIGKCPFCNSDRADKTDEEQVAELMKRVDVNDAGAMTVLGSYNYHGKLGLLRDREKAMELYARAAELGSSEAHFALGFCHSKGGDLKKTKFQYEAAAMAGHESARYNLGCKEYESGDLERAVKHWMIAASAGHCDAMDTLLIAFEQGAVSRESIETTVAAYNNSCAEMRSEARDVYIRAMTEYSIYNRI